MLQFLISLLNVAPGCEQLSSEYCLRVHCKAELPITPSSFEALHIWKYRAGKHSFVGHQLFSWVWLLSHPLPWPLSSVSSLVSQYNKRHWELALCVTLTRLFGESDILSSRSSQSHGWNVVCPKDWINKEPRLNIIKGTVFFLDPSLELFLIVVGKLLGIVENRSPSSSASAELASSPGCQGLCQVFVIALTWTIADWRPLNSIICIESRGTYRDWHLTGHGTAFQHLAPAQCQSGVQGEKSSIMFWHELACVWASGRQQV